MDGDKQGLVYRVVADGDRWRWEVMANGRCVAFGVAATSAVARAHAFLFLDPQRAAARRAAGRRHGSAPMTGLSQRDAEFRQSVRDAE